MAETRVVITAQADQAIQEYERFRQSSTGSLQQAATASEQMLNRTGASAAQTAAALKQLPMQISDIVVSLQGGQAPLTVFLQQGSQIAGSFGGAGAALRATAGYVVGLINPFTMLAAAVAVAGVAYHEGSKEVDAYNKAIILSGNVAGVTAGQLADMARNVSESVGTQAAAAEVVAMLAGSGQVAAENITAFAKSAQFAQRSGSKSAQDMVKDFVALGEKPVEATIKLNEQYHYLTAAVYLQIKALEDQGQKDEAAALAQQSYSDAMEKRSKSIETNLGYIQKAWNATAEAAKKGWDALLDIGREDTLSEKIKKAQKELDKAKANRYTFAGAGEDGKERLNTAQNKLDALIQEKNSSEWNTKVAADTQKLNEATTKWSQEGEKYLSKQDQLKREIERQTKLGLEAGLSDKDINDRIKLINAKYGDQYNASLAALEGKRALDREVLAGQLADLESSHRQQLVSDTEFIAKKRDLQVADILGEEAVVKKQIEIASGKADLSERNKYVAALDVLEQRRKNIIKGAANETADVAAASAKVIRDQTNAWKNATIAEQQQLADEVGLFGKSAEARAIAVAQIKVDADARDLLAKKTAEGHSFTEKDLADLKAEAEARKKNIATIMGEQQARAGAEQLRQENIKFSLEAIADDKQRAAAQLAVDAQLWRDRIALAADGSDAQKRLQEQFDQWYSNRQMAPVIDQWKTVIGNLDNNFQEGFRDMLSNGQGTWRSFSKSISNTLKTSLADALYQTFAKQYVVSAIANLAGIISGPGAAAALAGQSGLSVLGAAGSASSIYSAVGTAGLIGSAGSGIAYVGNALGSSTLSAFGAGFAGSGPAAMGTVAEGFAQAGMAAEASAASLGAAFSAAIPWIAAAGAAALVWKNFFEDGPEQNTRLTFASNNTAGNISINERGNEGKRDAYIAGSGKSAFGTFGVSSTFWAPAESEVVQSFIKTVTQTDDALAAFLTTTEKANVSSYLTGKTSTANTGAEGNIGNSQAELAKVFKERIANILDGVETGLSALEAGFTGTSQELATETAALLSYRSALKDSGEAVFGVKVTLQEIAALKQPTEATSVALNRIANEFSATNTVAQLLGRDVATAFGAVGLASEAARSQVILLSGGLSNFTSQTASFAQNYFTEAERLVPTAKAVDEAMKNLGLSSITTTEQFKEFIVGHRDADGVLRGGLDLSTESGAKMFAALMDIQDAFKKVHDQANNATSALDPFTEQKSAITTAYENESQAIQTTIDKMKSFGDSMRDFNKSLLLGDLSTLSPAEKYKQAKQQYLSTLAAAEGGDATAQGALQGAATAFLQASRSANASSAQYQSDFALVQQSTSTMAKWADGQVSAEQASLAALKAQVAGIVDVKNAVLTVNDTIAALASAMGASGASLLANSQTASIEQLYQSLLGRHSDAGGMAFYQSALGRGATIAQISDSITSSAEYLARVAPNSTGRVRQGGVSTDSLTQLSNLDYSSMGTANMGALVNEIRTLRSDNQALATQLQAIKDELQGSRRDSRDQTTAVVGSNFDSTNRAAQIVTEAIQTAVQQAARQIVFLQENKIR